jgi:hypothetical protein
VRVYSIVISLRLRHNAWWPALGNASINIIESTFEHNLANFHAGVFYIDESHTTVNGSLFINNSAALARNSSDCIISIHNRVPNYN